MRKTEKITEKQNLHVTVINQTCLYFLFLQLLQVFSYLGCLGQQGRIQQVISITAATHLCSLNMRSFKALISHFPFFVVVVFAAYILVKNNSGVKPAGQCGTWVKEPEGGLFTSPNYPNKYPPDTECVYILEGRCSV